MSNIIDTIQVSGVTYTIAGGGSGNSVVEVTQAQYDALVSGGTVDPTILYIITDAQAGDLTQYWTSAQTQSAITEATSGKVDTSDFNTYSASVETALSGKASQSDLETVSGQVANKQDTLVSGTNIKTINNQSLLGSGNITIQGGGGGGTIDPSLDSGSTNAVANSAITEAVNSKVNIADNNVSGFTYEASLKNVYNYSDEFTGPIYVKYGGDSSTSFTDRYAGDMTIYHGQYSSAYVTLRFDVLNGAITATSTSSEYITITIQDGDAIVTPSSGCYFADKIRAANNFVFFRKIVYSSGQSANVIENTVYPMFGNLKDELGNAVGEVGLHTTGRGGIGVNYTSLNGTRVTGNDVQLASSTIYMDGEGKLNTQFATPQSSQKVLNTGQYNYCYLLDYLDYSDAYDDLTITFNPEGYEGGNVSFNFNLTFVKNHNTTNLYSFTYSTTTSGLTYWDSSLDNYCTKDDTISTDYKLKITAKDGYKINTFRSTNCSIGGVDTQYPEDYIVTLVTTTSNVQNGQNVIDDIYSTLSGKQDTLVSGTNIKTINNQSLLGSGNIDIQGGGGKAVSGGTNISITTGETADTINCTLPITVQTQSQDYNNLVLFNQSNNVFSHNKTSRNIIFGSNNQIGNPFDSSSNNIIIGHYNTMNQGFGGTNPSFNFFVGDYNNIGKNYSENASHTAVFGTYLTPKNSYEYAFGKYNNSVTGSATWGDSGNTLFSVGNGTSNNARHNALEIRQNGDIYITLDGQDVKLQDQLGGGSITVDDMLSSTSTNPVQNKVVKSATDRICKLFGYGTSGQTDMLAWATGATSAVIDDYVQFSKINGKKIIGNGVSPTDNFSLVETSAITSSITSSSTDAQVPSAKAVYESVSGKVDTSSMSGYVTTNTKQEITGNKTFIGSSSTSEKPIIFKQVNDNHKIGFVCRNTASTNNELATFEFRPNTFTIDNVQHPLLYFGHYRNTNTANAGVPQTVIGFRQYDQLNNAAYHYLIPLPEKAKTPFSLTTSFKDYYAPMGFKNGSTMITADDTGVVDLSSELGGLKLKKLTQAEYDALATKDNSTLYVIVN